MNDVIDNVMTFINENTTILIIICVFLIVVLVVYLIENAIKSSSVNKKIENDKKKIEEKIKIEENVPKTSKFEDAVVEDSPKVEEIFNEIPVDAIDEPKETEEEKNYVPIENLNEDSSLDNTILDMDKIIAKEETNAKEKDNSVDVLYKNDKKLSEILFGNIEKQPEGKLSEDIVKNSSSEEMKELSESVNELDRIMKKLNDYDKNSKEIDDEETFSNIF